MRSLLPKWKNSSPKSDLALESEAETHDTPATEAVDGENKSEVAAISEQQKVTEDYDYDPGWIGVTLEASTQDMGWISSTMAPERMFIEEIVEGSWAEEMGLQVRVTLEASTQDMGWISSTMAPERMFIEEIVEGSWAEEMGLQVRDELFSIAGIEVIVMDEQSFSDALKERPVELFFYRFADWGNNEDGANNEEAPADAWLDSHPATPRDQATPRSQGTPRSAGSQHSRNSTKSKVRSGSDRNSERSKGSKRSTSGNGQNTSTDGRKTSTNGIRTSRTQSENSKADKEQDVANTGTLKSAITTDLSDLLPESMDAEKVKAPVTVSAAASRWAAALKKVGSSAPSSSNSVATVRWNEVIESIDLKFASDNGTSSGRLKSAKSADSAEIPIGAVSSMVSDSPRSPKLKMKAKQSNAGHGSSMKAALALRKEKVLEANKEKERLEPIQEKEQEDQQREDIKDPDKDPDAVLKRGADPPIIPRAVTHAVGFVLELARQAKKTGASPSHKKVGMAGMKFVTKEIVVKEEKKKERVVKKKLEQAHVDSQFDVNAQGIWHATYDHREVNSDGSSESDLDIIAWKKKVRTNAAKSKAKAKRRPRSAENFERQKNLEDAWMPPGRANSILLKNRSGFVPIAPLKPEEEEKDQWVNIFKERLKIAHQIESGVEEKKLEEYFDKKLEPQCQERVDFWFGEELEKVQGKPVTKKVNQYTLDKEHKAVEDKIRKNALEKIHRDRMRRNVLVADATENLDRRDIELLTAHLNFYIGASESKWSDDKKAKSAAARKERELQDKLERRQRAIDRGKVLHGLKDVSKLEEKLRQLKKQHDIEDEEKRQMEEDVGKGAGMNLRTRESIAQIDDNHGHLREAFMTRVEEEYREKEGSVLDELIANLRTARGPWTKKDADGHFIWNDNEQNVIHVELPIIAEVCRTVMQKYTKDNHGQFPLPLSPHFKKSLALVCMLLYTKTDVDIDRLFKFKDVKLLPPGFELPAARDEFYRAYRAMAKKQGRNPQMFQDANWGTRIAWEGSLDPDSERTLEGWTKFTTWVKWICLLGVMSEKFKPPRKVTRGLTGLPESILENFKKKQKGDTIFWPALSSTTEDSTISWHYCNQLEPVEKNAVFTIKKVTEGLEIARVSQYPNEKELLLPPFSLLEVLQVRVVPDHPIEIDCVFKGCTLSDSLKELCEKDFEEAQKQVIEAEEKMKKDEKDRIALEKKLEKKAQREKNKDGDGDSSSSNEYEYDHESHQLVWKRKKKKTGDGNDDENEKDENKNDGDETEQKRIIPRFRVHKSRELWNKWETFTLHFIKKVMNKTAGKIEKRLHFELGDGFNDVFGEEQGACLPWKLFPKIWERYKVTASLVNEDKVKQPAFRPAANSTKIPLGMSEVSVSIHDYNPMPLNRVQSAPGALARGSRSDTRTSTSTQRPSTTSRRSTLQSRKPSVLRFAPGV